MIGIKVSNKESRSVADFPENATVMLSEPLAGVSVSDVRCWLIENDTEFGLATALARVHNKTGWLMHDLDELEDLELAKAETAFNEWVDLETELYNKAIAILKEENASGKTHHDISKKGLNNIVIPFMERNGFRDGAGWWI